MLAFIYLLFERGIFREFSGSLPFRFSVPSIFRVSWGKEEAAGEPALREHGATWTESGEGYATRIVLPVTPVTAHSFLRE